MYYVPVIHVISIDEKSPEITVIGELVIVCCQW